MNEGDFWETGTEVGGERGPWAGLGWGGGFEVAGRRRGFGGTGQGSDGDFKGCGGTGAGGERALLVSFSTDEEGLLISAGLTGEGKETSTCLCADAESKYKLIVLKRPLLSGSPE